MTVVHEISQDSFKVVENFKTSLGARTLAVDTKTHYIYMPSAVGSVSFFVMDIALLKQ